MFFPGRSLVFGLLSTLKPKNFFIKALKTYKNLKAFSTKNLGFFQSWPHYTLRKPGLLTILLRTIGNTNTNTPVKMYC